MIDLILFSFWIGTFAAGWWCRSKFGTLAAMKNATIDWVKSFT